MTQLYRAAAASNRGDALDLCRLLAAEEDPRFERAAVRRQGRFVVERGGRAAHGIAACLAALAELPLGSKRSRPA